MEALRYKPCALWRLDDASPFTDYSGYGRSGTATGTEVKGISLTSDSLYSQLFNSTHVGTFAAPVYLRGNESRSFSLHAVIYSNQRDGSIQVLGKPSQMDGLAVEGSNVTFSTNYTSSGSAKCSYNLDDNQKISVVGVHTQAKNSLYINGELVDEVDITVEQQADTFASTSTNLSSGSTTGSDSIYANNFAAFTHALQPEAIRALHAATNSVAPGSVPKMFGGEVVAVGPSVRPPYLLEEWSDSDDWRSGDMVDVVVDGDQLYSPIYEGLTVAGTWTTTVDLYNGATPTPINSINIWWEGENETVEASIDGTTWTAVTKGVNLSIIPAGFDPTGKTLRVRVSFAAGLEEAYLTSLMVRGYLTDTTTSANRTVTYNNATVLIDEGSPSQLRDDVGVSVGTGGSIVIGPEGSSVPTPVRTIELWVKPSASTSATMGVAASNNYKNGISAGATLDANEWTLYHRVLSADFTGTLTINIPGQIASVAFYDTALTAAQVAAIAANYTGVNTARYDDSGIVSIAESPTSLTVYAHDWEVLPA